MRNQHHISGGTLKMQQTINQLIDLPKISKEFLSDIKKVTNFKLAH